MPISERAMLVCGPLVVLIVCGLCVAGTGERLPARPKQQFQWQTASPQSQGMSAEKLDELRDLLAAKDTKGLLIIRGDRIVCEWYTDGFGPDKRHYTASLAKALVGGMSLGLAMNDGRIRPDDLACKYIPQWRSHPRKSRITIHHLATHTSGIEDAEAAGISHEKLPGWKGAFWRGDPDPFTIARDRAPVLFDPGTNYRYSNPGMGMLSYAVTAAIQPGPNSQRDIRRLLGLRIYRPIGIRPNTWSVGYGRTYEVDGLPLVANWGGGEFTPRATARIGRLMLRKGNWEGAQLIGEEVVDEVLARSPAPSWKDGRRCRGLCWRTNYDGSAKSLPPDAFMGAGAGHQILLVVPSLDLIVVRNGSLMKGAKGGKGLRPGFEEFLFRPLMEAIVHNKEE